MSGTTACFLSGLFLEKISYKKKSAPVSYNFVPLDIRIPVCKSSLLATKFTFGPKVRRKSDVEILHSCNGLLLCRTLYGKLYVYNPSITNMFKVIPEPDNVTYYRISHMAGLKMAFDPTKSPHYKVIYGERVRDTWVQIHTYSSETGNWSLCGHLFPLGLLCFKYDGVYWNDAICWLDYDSSERKVFKLDMMNDHPVLTALRTPLTLDGKVHNQCYLFESRGCLLLVGKDNACSRHFTIYEKGNVYSEWSVKYIVNLDDIIKPLPKMWNCCSWGGVTCSIKGQVMGLDLSNEMISGGIDDSSALFGLKHLESLNFTENDFSQIPGELSQLTRLEILDLSELFYIGICSLRLQKPNLSSLVQNLTRLRGLYLDNVNISAQKLDWCQGLSSSLPNLEVLSLSDCQLSGPLDDSLGNLQSLSVIRLDYNNLSAPIPDFFANFKNLTVINLASCNLIGTFPKKVLQLQSLQTLDLALNNNLSGSLPDFPINGSLQSLVLSNTNFSGAIPESIGNLKNLSRINLHQSNFSGRIPKSMEKLTHLSYIDLSVNRLTGQIPSFQLCKNLAYIDLSRNSLSGMIPSPYFQDLQSLLYVELSDNNFDGLLPQFSNSSVPLLNWLDLSGNKLRGEIPRSFFDLGQLSVLMLSSNNLSGVIETKYFQGLGNLVTLDLSFNQFSIITSSNSSIVSHLPKLYALNFASCNLQKFPNLQNHSTLMYVDLSDNNIQGEIPNWIWEVGNGELLYMNVSHNQLTGLEEPYTFPVDLTYLDLHSNNLSGVIHVPQTKATYIDYSNNRLNLSLSEISWRDFIFLTFFSASNNLLAGTIPKTICNTRTLEVVDLSNNRLTGRIPQCLIEFGNDLGVLNLANNGLTGQIEGTFPTTCSLNTLDLHGNYLEGKIPQSIVNCRMLHVLNLGNNSINDTYPCSLATITDLHVLVLRFNRLHGSIHCGRRQYNWSNLQILDIAHNDFSGVVPPDFFRQWGAMMTVENRASTTQLSYMVLEDLYYQDSVTVTVKGFEFELV
ncbi:receptor-like protein 7, partial [Tanacetum coccineum]